MEMTKKIYLENAPFYTTYLAMNLNESIDGIRS